MPTDRKLGPDRDGLNLFGSHSPPLAAYLARVSEPDVLLTRHTRMAHRLFSEYPAPWGGDLLLVVGLLSGGDPSKTNVSALI